MDKAENPRQHRKLIFILKILLCILSHETFSQGNVSIGTLSPDQSAILDLSNPDHKGLLIPSMTTAQKNSLASPANGLMIYQTDSTKGFYFFESAHWRRIGEGGNAWIETDSAVYTMKKVGIGVSDPQAAYHSKGSFMIEGESIKGKQVGPIPEYNMPLTITTYTDSSGVLYDDGGPNNNYSDLRNLKVNVDPVGEQIGTLIEITFMNILQGDTIIIGNFLDSVKFSGSVSFKKLFHDASATYIKFRSNVSGNAAGFKLRWDGIYAKAGIINPDLYFPEGLVYNDSLKSLSVGDLTPKNSPGIYSFAAGKYVEASGDYAISMGKFCEASGPNSLALGVQNMAIGEASTAIGHSNYASGDISTTIGYGNISSGIESIAIGFQATASNTYSIALGSYTHANGESATAMGNESEANGINSTSTGYGSEANGDNSLTAGKITTANGFCGTALGMYNDPIVNPQTFADLNSSTPLFIIGNGDAYNALSNAMVVRKDGHVGIGTNTPRVKLHVTNGNDAGYADGDGYTVFGSVSSANVVFDNNEILARNNGAASDLFLQHSGGKVLIGTGGTDHLFDVNGTAGKPGGGTWSTYSDQRLKQNILPYEDGLAAILQIHPIRYHYNALSGFDTHPEYVGVIAQDLQKIAPYMISESQKQMEDGSTGYLEIDNSAMIYMLINAVKELSAEIEKLKIEVAGNNNED